MDRTTGDSVRCPERSGETRAVAAGKPRDVIRNEEQYQLVQEQLGRLQRALADLERQFLPGGEQQLRLFAEAYEDTIATLEAQLRAFEASRGAA